MLFLQGKFTKTPPPPQKENSNRERAPGAPVLDQPLVLRWQPAAILWISKSRKICTYFETKGSKTKQKNVGSAHEYILARHNNHGQRIRPWTQGSKVFPLSLSLSLFLSLFITTFINWKLPQNLISNVIMMNFSEYMQN